MKDFRIKTLRTCAGCRGDGIVQADGFVEFIKTHPNPMKAAKEEMPTTSEEINCPDCNGGGFVEDWIWFSELMTQIRKELEIKR